MTVNFYPERRGKSQLRHVYAYIREKKKTIQINTKMSVDIDKWNKDKQRVSRGHNNAAQINSALDRLSLEIKGYHADFLRDVPVGTIDLFKPYLLEKLDYSIPIEEVTEEVEKDIIILYDEFIQIKTVQYKESTIKKYVTLRNILIEYSKSKRKVLKFSNLNMAFFEDLYGFLIKKRKQSNNTIHKNIKNFNTFLNWCYDSGYTKEKIKSSLKIKTNPTRAIALSINELNRLYSHKFEIERLARVRDVFCFACYTGARYSDIETIKREQFTETHWKYRSPKTGKLISVPLQNEAKQIIAKYLDDIKPLPVITAQKLNEYLKEVCKAVGIDTPTVRESAIGGKISEETVPKYEMITFHTARRTFATLAINAGKSTTSVMRITGHSSIATLMKYIKTTAEHVEDEFDGAWF